MWVLTRVVSKAYKLLSEALKESGKVGIAQHTMRGS